MRVWGMLLRCGAFRVLRVRVALSGALCAALILAMGCAAESEGDAEAAPDFTLTLFDTATRDAGETMRLSDLEGKPVVLNFWFPSCPPCVAEMPEFERVYQKHRADGVEFVGIQLLGIDSAEDGQKFVKDLGISYAIGADEDDIISKYKVSGFPMTVFIDGEQNIARRWQGVLNEEKMDEILSEIVN